MNWNLKVKLKSVKMIQTQICDSDNDIEYVPDSVDDSDPEDEEISIRTTTKQKIAISTPKKERLSRLQPPEAETIPGPSHAQPVPPAKPRARKNKYSMTLLKLTQIPHLSTSRKPLSPPKVGLLSMLGHRCPCQLGRY